MIPSWLSRYGRRRRLIAAALAATSVICAFLATRPTTATTPTVLVASRDLSPGPVSPADFHLVALDPPPAGAVRDITPGQTLATPMRRGEPLTDVRLLSSYRLPPGLVAAPVRIADAATAALIAPGSTITLLAAYQEATHARQIASDTQVLTIPKPPPQSSDDGTLIVLAVTPPQAAELAAAQAQARLSITIKPNYG